MESDALHISTVTLYADLTKTVPIFSFNVGTLDNTEEAIREVAKQSYIP